MLLCSLCQATLGSEDGHDMCPRCLGIDHLRQAMTEQACVNCACLTYAARAARLATIEAEALPSSGMPVLSPQTKTPQRLTRKRKTQKVPNVNKTLREGENPLSSKVESLASEFAQIKALLVQLQPGAGSTAGVTPQAPLQVNNGTEAQVNSQTEGHQEEDALSIAASDSMFAEYLEEDEEVRSQSGSTADSAGEGQEPDDVPSAVKQAVQLALSQLGVEVPAAALPTNAFFRDAQQAPFGVPPSDSFLSELHCFWKDPTKGLHFPQDCRALSTMPKAGEHGLDGMPAMDSNVAHLIVSRREAANPDARCPLRQCQLTDGYISKAYDTAARMARLANSHSHLILALDQALDSEDGDDSVKRSLSVASLRAFGYMSRELGRLMSTLILARRQVWLAQSPFEPGLRTALGKLPVVPGQVFGPGSQETLDRYLQGTRSRRQFTDTRQEPASRLRGVGSSCPVLGARGFSGASRPPLWQDRSQWQPSQPTFRVPIGRAPKGGSAPGRSKSSGRGGRR